MAGRAVKINSFCWICIYFLGLANKIRALTLVFMLLK